MTIQNHPNNNEFKKLFPQFFFPTVFIIALWMIKIFEITMDISFSQYGIFPRRLEGLKGIIFYPLIHKSLEIIIVKFSA